MLNLLENKFSSKQLIEIIMTIDLKELVRWSCFLLQVKVKFLFQSMARSLNQNEEFTYEDQEIYGFLPDIILWFNFYPF